MKIKAIFAAIALFAIASAFTTSKFADHAYQYLSSFTFNNVAYYEVGTTDQINNIGSLPGQVSCDNTGNCMVETNSTPTTVDGKNAIPQSSGTISTGTFTQH